MKKVRVLVLALCLVLGLYSGASAIPTGPFAQFFVYSGSTLVDSFTFNGTGDFSFTSTHFAGALTGTFKAIADPRIEYSFGFVNGAAPLNFSALFVTPAAPALVGPTLGKAELSVGITDNGPIGWALGLFALPSIQENFADLTPPFTAPVGFAPLGAPGAGAGAASASFATPGDPFVNIAGPVLGVAYPWFITEVSWGSSAFDGFTFTGNCELNVVPVPPTLILMGSGLLGLVGLRRFRKI